MLEINKASTYCIEIYTIEHLYSTLLLLIHSDSSSNICLCTSTDLLYNCKVYIGIANSIRGEKAQVIAYRELYALFKVSNINFQIIINRDYVILLNKHYTLGLVPFKKAGYIRAIHSMHK